MTAPTPPTDPDAQQREATRQDGAALQAAVGVALASTLATWLAAASAAVLAGGLVSVAALPLPTTLIARTLTRIRPDVIRVWARIMARFGVSGYDNTGVEQILTQAGLWIDSADEHAYQMINKLVVDGQARGLTPEQTRATIRAALHYDSWQTWTARTAELVAGYAVEAAKASAVSAAGGVWSKTWISELDSEVRPTHMEAHGQTVPASGVFIVGGWPMRIPHDPNAPISETINCRCEADYQRT